MHPEITVQVTPEYLDRQSCEGRYAFAYHITISNHGNEPAQLLNRHWVINDGNQDIQEVRGEGVIGEQPIIEPGSHYQYSSGVAIATPVGTMQGSYQMQSHNGELFETTIDIFRLAVPGSIN